MVEEGENLGKKKKKKMKKNEKKKKRIIQLNQGGNRPNFCGN